MDEKRFFLSRNKKCFSHFIACCGFDVCVIEKKEKKQIWDLKLTDGNHLSFFFLSIQFEIKIEIVNDEKKKQAIFVKQQIAKK